ncbi:MAG: sodium:alanine symporter family protein [Oscillospiraceae bacterium]|nr:sodium:alanine symporter family protein [Oscillospiraceae bacterium]
MQTATHLLWSIILPFLLSATAFLYLIRLRGKPVCVLHRVLRDTYGSLLHRTDQEQHRIFAAALAATMGTGNLAGTALALIAGGPGAIFWMWISALLGTVLVTAENLLSSRFSGKSRNGIPCGGALGYLGFAFKSGIPAAFFAFCCICSALGMGNLAQSSTIAQSAAAFGIPLPVSGLITAFLFGIVLCGGIQRIRGAALRLMPLLCGIYLFCCAVLLCMHAAALPNAILRIIREAFGFRAAGGGFTAALFLRSMHEGIKRGIFSNEAGLGSSGLLHMDAAGGNQWKWATAEVFADTVICCTATALVILTAPGISLHRSEPAALLLQAFSSGLGKAASAFLAVNMILLAFATMIGWFPCGLAAFRFLFGSRQEGLYLALCISAAFAGAFGSPLWLWCFCDLCNGCMALPNLLGMMRLSSRIRAEDL